MNVHRFWRIRHGHQPARTSPGAAAQAELAAAQDPGSVPRTPAAADTQPTRAPGADPMISPVAELAEAQQRMAAIRADLVPTRLFEAVLAAAQAAATARQVGEAVSESTEAVRACLWAGDALGAMAAAEELVAAERLVPILPSAEVDSAAVAEALTGAAGKLRDGLGPLGSVPELDYSLEQAAWESLSVADRAEVAPPVPLPADLEAQQAREGAESLRQRLLQAVRAWTERCGHPDDVLGLLASAGSLLEQLDAALDVLLEAEDAVVAANRAREAAGITWAAPERRTSAAIERLRKSSSDRRLAAPTF